MSGRAKRPAFQYDAEGKFIRKWECQADVRTHYFSKDVGKRPLFPYGEGGYGTLPDSTYIASYRIGRDRLMMAELIRKCPFCRPDTRARRIAAFNRLGERIATFSSISKASKLTGIDTGTLHYRVVYGRGSSNKTDTLIWKYDN